MPSPNEPTRHITVLNHKLLSNSSLLMEELDTTFFRSRSRGQITTCTFPAENMWFWRSPDAHLSKKEHHIQAVQWQEHQKVCTNYLSTWLFTSTNPTSTHFLPTFAKNFTSTARIEGTGESVREESYGIRIHEWVPCIGIRLKTLVSSFRGFDIGCIICLLIKISKPHLSMWNMDTNFWCKAFRKW